VNNDRDDHQYQGHLRSAPAVRRPYYDKDEQTGRGCKSLAVVVVVVAVGRMLAGLRMGGGKSEWENKAGQDRRIIESNSQLTKAATAAAKVRRECEQGWRVKQPAMDTKQV